MKGVPHGLAERIAPVRTLMKMVFRESSMSQPTLTPRTDPPGRRPSAVRGFV